MFDRQVTFVWNFDDNLQLFKLITSMKPYILITLTINNNYNQNYKLKTLEIEKKG